MAAPPSSSSQPRIRIARHSIQITCCKELLSKDIVLELVQIPSGKFLMGSPKNEIDRSLAESPQHRVQISGFWMGRYPVTQAQWRVVAVLPRVKRDLKTEPSGFKGNNRPVEQVSWHDAIEFCARLSAHTKRQYRLPSEAEWEYACRAGTTSPFSCGNTITTDIANYNGRSTYGRGIKGKYRKETTRVDQFKLANPWGLCDMHGNVLEWCLDHWHENYEEAPADGSAWLSEDEKAVRVIRGGSWNNSPKNCRSAYRGSDRPDSSYNAVGFRVVVAPRGLH